MHSSLHDRLDPARPIPIPTPCNSSRSYATAVCRLAVLASADPAPRLSPPSPTTTTTTTTTTTATMPTMSASHSTPPAATATAFLPVLPLRSSLASSPVTSTNSTTRPPAPVVMSAPDPQLPQTPSISATSLRIPPPPPRAPAPPPTAHTDPTSREFHGIPNPAPGEKLTLSDLRDRLIRQEETIIFSLIERAQFRLNDIIYEEGAFDGLPDYSAAPSVVRGDPSNASPASSTTPHSANGNGNGNANGNGNGKGERRRTSVSFSQYMLYELERVHSRVRRYTSPDENAFAPAHILPAPVLPHLNYPPTLVENAVNVNDQIQQVYRSSILPSICAAGDDQNYGSSATCDAACLQALSKRIHYGKFIAEAKCLEDEAAYRALAHAGDRNGIWDLLTNTKVEQILLKRVEQKARSYGSCITDVGPRPDADFKVDPLVISNLYRDFIIPLTKVVEVDYILHRYNLEKNGDSMSDLTA